MQVVGAATPSSSPSSPKTNQIVAAGAGVGLVLGILLAVVIGNFDRRLWSPRDVDEIFGGWSVLGAIPRSRLVAGVSNANRGNLSAVEQESFAMLYANLIHRTDGEVRSVLVTSATGGEGKSTVALNLAHAAAHAGAEVLLIEADLRHPTLASRVGVESNGDTGLVDFLAGDVPLTEVIHPIPLAADGAAEPDEDHEAPVGPQNLQLVPTDGQVTYSRSTDIVPFNGHRNGSNATMNHVDVVFAGRLNGSAESARMNRFRLLASAGMQDLILAAEQRYDLVVIDTPPMSVVADAIPLMKCVSGVLVVSLVQQDTRESARRVRDQLSNLRVRTLGVVVNGVQSTEGQRNRNSPRFAAS
jgi:Mrp family chromosome partitioning ATPase